MPSFPRALRTLGCAALLAVAALPVQRAFARTADDARATFVLPLGKYVTWPQTAFASPSAPIVVAEIGNPARASGVRRLAAGQVFDGHPLEVREVSDASGAASALIVFAPDPAQSSALAAARPLRVIEGSGYLSRTDIQIQMHEGRVAFALNRKTEQRGLELSSKLLRLASSLD
jgi:hypothetical protein